MTRLPSPESSTGEPASQTLRAGALTLGSFVAVFWGLEIVDQVLFRHSGTLASGLDLYGILPRHSSGLIGILLAPFLHGGFAHVAANTVPFVLLGALVMAYGLRVFWQVTILVALIAGAGTWLFGSESYHIGASSLIFGYFGFLLAAGIFEHSLKSILLAVIVGVGYGGIIWGVLPGQPGISWEGHLFGFLGGVVAAKKLGRRPAQ